MLILLVGPSCSGKTTCVRFLRDRFGFQVVVPFTTRLPRADEINNLDYRFTNNEQLDLLSNGFKLGYWARPVDEHLYGFLEPMEQFAGDNFKAVAVAHSSIALAIKAKASGVLSIFLDTGSHECLERRLGERFATDTQLISRRMHAHHEKETKALFDFVVENDNISELLHTVEQIVVQLVPHCG